MPHTWHVGAYADGICRRPLPGCRAYNRDMTKYLFCLPMSLFAVAVAATTLATAVQAEPSRTGGNEALPRPAVVDTRPEPKDRLLRAVPAASRLVLAERTGSDVRPAVVAGSSGPLAVLYPDIGEPYRGVFARIIEGIEAKAGARVASYAIGNQFDARQLADELRQQGVRVVIALGRNGLKAANGLDKRIGVVVGGVISVPDSDSRGGTVLSLAPDPALLFARLKSVAPQIRRIYVVYNPRQNGWLIRLAQAAAHHEGLELVAREAGDLKSALTLYQQLLAGSDPQRDALWLPQDGTTVDESTVVPLVLQESWSRGLVVFSSNVSHVRRGALFGLYPDNLELGRNLAASALGLAGGGPAGGTQPLREVQGAFNTRTANHLGLELSAEQQRSFDLLFPER